MTITICHDKPPDRKWAWSVEDVIPGRDGPENLRILKRRSWILTVERCSLVFRVSTDRDLKHHKVRHALGVGSAWYGQHNMVSKDF